MRLAVLGAGAWGTAIAAVAAARNDVVLYARDAGQAHAIADQRCNARYLPAAPLPAALRVTSDLDTALAHGAAGLTLIATPTAALRSVGAALAARPPAPLLWLCKGFEQASGLMAHQILADVLGAERVAQTAGPLSGPSFAQEVAAGLPTALTVAGPAPLCSTATAALHGGALRIYSTDDVIGVEVGGSVKNVLAIACGIADALQLGLNARAALITRGLAEMSRLGVALGARAETFTGLTGLGDLILTATGDLSRNRQVGLMLGRGVALADALERLGHVAEGVRSAPAVLARAGAAAVDMPLAAAVAAVLAGQVSPAQALQQLLARDPKREQA